MDELDIDGPCGRVRLDDLCYIVSILNSLMENSAAATEVPLIAPFPIDDISERSTIEIGAQIGAEDIYGSMPILVIGARDKRRDQHPRIGPEPRHGGVFEFTDIDIERGAS
jgi:hypothetical protein